MSHKLPDYLIYSLSSPGKTWPTRAGVVTGLRSPTVTGTPILRARIIAWHTAGALPNKPWQEKMAFTATARCSLCSCLSALPSASTMRRRRRSWGLVASFARSRPSTIASSLPHYQRLTCKRPHHQFIRLPAHQ
jgi:hypothetical protein